MSTNETNVSHRKVVASSDRAFGLVFAAVFAIVGAWPLVFGNGGPRLWAFAIAAAFLAAALFFSRVLAPFNFVWGKIGLALHRVTNPIVMGFVYFTVFVPVGLVLRLMGKDPLRLKWNREAPSYWIIREPPGPARGSMAKQF